MNRGNRKARIFADDHDRQRFLRILAEAAGELSVVVLSLCLMGNHFHMKLTTPNANLSQFMDALEGRYAAYYNWKHHFVGHVFQGRFKDVLIENDVHLLTAACYVFMNPVVAGLATGLESWKWSSYGATIGLTTKPDYLSIDWITALCPAPSLQQSQRMFRELMSQSHPVIAYLRESDQEVEASDFRVIVRSYIGANKYKGPIPAEYRSLLRPTLDELFTPGIDKANRDARIAEAHQDFGYTFAEVAQALKLHRVSVGRIYRTLRGGGHCDET